MTYLEFAQMVGSVPLAVVDEEQTYVPFAYYQFTQETAKEPPFICYYFTNDNDFGADNINYQAIRTAVIELYTDNKDFTLEAAVETLLKNNEMRFTKNEAYISSEKMYLVTYETEVVISNG